MTDKKTNVLSTLSSFNTLLNDFPSLLTVDFNGDGEDTTATVSFLIDLAGLFGMTEKKLLEWISSILTEDDNPKKNGILNVLEESIKAALLLHFNSLYTNCETSPIIPDEFLKYSYTNRTETNGKGIRIRVSSIDMFNQLRFYPIGDTGQMFYFDINAESVSQPKYLYRSCDMNAWLWWIINYSRGENHPWDNRVFYKKQFKGSGGDEIRVNFVDTYVSDSPSYMVNDIGIKKHIISATYTESQEGNTTNPFDYNYLTVYGCAETYKRDDILKQNKSVFEFNTDFIYSLKLFDSKTLVAQIINALTGLSGAMFGQLSLELNVLIKKVEKTVELVISKPIKNKDEGYFVFSDEEYNNIVKDATLRYNGEYETHNETDEKVILNVGELTNAIKKIDNAETSKDKEDAIVYAIKTISDATNEYSAGINTPFVQQKDIIIKFIKEIITQIALQVLSPKVMLLFAINQYFLTNQGSEKSVQIDITGFLNDFWNIISSCVLRVGDLILESLYNLVIGFIRPILVLVVEKLLLETLTYYKQLLQQLLDNCLPTFSFNGNTTNLTIDNVNYADIIPRKTTP